MNESNQYLQRRTKYVLDTIILSVLRPYRGRLGNYGKYRMLSWRTHSLVQMLKFIFKISVVVSIHSYANNMYYGELLTDILRNIISIRLADIKLLGCVTRTRAMNSCHDFVMDEKDVSRLLNFVLKPVYRFWSNEIDDNVSRV